MSEKTTAPPTTTGSGPPRQAPGSPASGRGHRRGLPRPPPAAHRDRRLGAARRRRRGRGHLRRLRRLELRPGRGRLRRPARRHRPHGRHVHVHGARPGRDGLGPADRGRRLHLRPPGARAVGRVRHRHRRAHRVRHRPGRDRHVHRRLRRGARAVRHHRRLVGLPRGVRAVHRHPPARRGRGAQGHARRRGRRRARPRRVPRRRGPRLRRGQPHRHPRTDAAGANELFLLRRARRVGGVPVRHLVLPRRGVRAARRRGGQGPGALHAPRHPRRDGPARRPRRPHARRHPRRRRAPRRSPASGNPPVDALATAGLPLGPGHPGQLRRPRRPGRELLRHRLRLLPADLRAVPGRLPAPRAVGDQRPQGPGARPARARRGRLPAVADRPGGHAAQHGRLRRHRVLRAHDGQPHRPAPPRARPGAAVPHPGRDRHHRRRAGRWPPRPWSRRSSSTTAPPCSPCVVYAGFLAYFGLYSRHHLVAAAPEEEFAALAAAEVDLR